MLKDNLKAARLRAGMTLDDVAQKVGVSRQTIQRYESGVIQNIPSDNIEKMAKALNVSPGVLMGWESSETAPQSTPALDPASILLDDEEIRTLARKGLEDASPEQAEKKKAQFKKIMSVVFDEDDDDE
jgi:transcriptional regulator